MRHAPISPELFVMNRARLGELLLPNSLALINTNDIPPTNADGTLAMSPNSDLFYLTGIEQEQSILLLYPAADDEKQRELLFLREPKPELEIWEGHKLTVEEARKLTGIKHVHWLSEFPRLFHRLMCECEHVYLNSNEHKRAVIEVETREARFVAETMRRYPLHNYQRLARLMHRLRAVKSELELDLIRKACAITAKGFRRVAKRLKPGMSEAEAEAEFAHEYIRGHARFAYLPIIASGQNACVLHYVENSDVCRSGELLLLDVAASYANYNSDLTRTLPVSGRFTRRQKQVYNAVLRVLRALMQGLTVGKKWKDWQKEAEQLIEKECVELGLLSVREIKRQDPDHPALKKYFMHGAGHPLGLDVHDVGLTTEPFQENWVMTVEPAIYIREEGLAVRLENDVWIRGDGNIDLMADIPVEADEIEELMNRRRGK
ncbi:MAG: Xaa-Pro aminopeptidase [Verrucomicrobiales bacterium]|nr:Xaa-Pro aminopeptidase [Verrucomicrobiales bacterium]